MSDALEPMSALDPEPPWRLPVRSDGKTNTPLVLLWIIAVAFLGFGLICGLASTDQWRIIGASALGFGMFTLVITLVVMAWRHEFRRSWTRVTRAPDDVGSGVE